MEILNPCAVCIVTPVVLMVSCLGRVVGVTGAVREAGGQAGVLVEVDSAMILWTGRCFGEGEGEGEGAWSLCLEGWTLVELSEEHVLLPLSPL